MTVSTASALPPPPVHSQFVPDTNAAKSDALTTGGGGSGRDGGGGSGLGGGGGIGLGGGGGRGLGGGGGGDKGLLQGHVQSPIAGVMIVVQ
jgi:hypothetical protein